MTSQVFYRKWRPQTLAEVVGQEHVTRTLLNALATGRVAHAYVFCGPRGTGKTSTGRILAKAVNCPTNGKGEPCNTCEMCLAITEGRALDIIEIDAASTGGVEDIRQLRERISLSPSVARKKVYIIDEAHMVSKEGSNALLKTLEEPPPHAIFVLATTEPHRLLTTLLSRCQRFDFRRLSHDAVISKLQYICQNEGISIEIQGLGLIAKSVSGSLRDAENLLQQLLVYYGDTVELHQVEEMLGVTTDFRVKELVQHIVSKNVAAGLATINSIVSDGLDLIQYNRGLIEYLRNLLLAKSGAEASLDVGAEDLAEIKELAGQIPVEDILKSLKHFGQIDFRFRDYSPLPLELALVESILPQEKGEAPKKAAAPGRPSTPTKRDTAPAVEAAPAYEEEHPREEQGITPDAGVAYIRAQWDEFVDSLRGVGSAGNLDAYLRKACEPVAIEDDTLVLAFYHSFHKEKIEDAKYRRMVEQRLSGKFGSPNKIRCILQPQGKQRAMNGHLVRAALEMGGRITSVEENPTPTGGEE